MKKISTLFKRDFDDKHNAILYPEFKEEFKHLLEDEDTIPTLKLDGTACAIIDGKFYKRYDAKKGKPAPEGAIPCDNPDPVTGHWPHWIEVKEDDKGSKWHLEAYKNTESKLKEGFLVDDTYEAVGPHFQNNPYHLDKDILVRHGIYKLNDLKRSLNFTNDTKLKTIDEMAYDVIRCYLLTHRLEGIVFWNKDKPVCKIKSKDYGIKWIDKDLSEDLFISWKNFNFYKYRNYYILLNKPIKSKTDNRYHDYLGSDGKVSFKNGCAGLDCEGFPNRKAAEDYIKNHNIDGRVCFYGGCGCCGLSYEADDGIIKSFTWPDVLISMYGIKKGTLEYKENMKRYQEYLDWSEKHK